MPADCLACQLIEPTIAEENKVGEKNNPIGCCVLCHSLMCGYHGRREPNDAEFICIMCVPLVATGVAVTQADSETQILRELRALFRRHAQIFPSELQREDPVLFFEQWRPNKKTFSKAKTMSARLKPRVAVSDDLRKTVLALIESEQTRTLLAIAKLAIDWYEIRDKDVPVRLMQILNAIEWEG